LRTLKNFGGCAGLTLPPPNPPRKRERMFPLRGAKPPEGVVRLGRWGGRKTKAGRRT
jgi:hypothetical protein